MRPTVRAPIGDRCGSRRASTVSLAITATQSFDSRFWGFAERRLILGRATAVAFSLDYDRHLAPRWQRFFRRLDS